MKPEIKIVQRMIAREIKQLSRFSMVGALNTFVDFTVFSLAYSLFGINYIVSQTVGYSLGTLNSFLFNKKWTFQCKNADKKIRYELLQFIIINIVSLSISQIFIKLLANKLNLNVYLSKVIVTFTTQITNFLGYKLWVFKE